MLFAAVKCLFFVTTAVKCWVHFNLLILDRGHVLIVTVLYIRLLAMESAN